MKFSFNPLVLIFVLFSTVFLLSCSHSSCPAYTYQKNNEIKPDYNLKENNIIIRNEISCSPCYFHGTFPECEHKTCLNSIGIRQVYKHLQDFLCEFSNTGNIKSMENESFLTIAPPYGPYLDYVWYKNKVQ